MPNRNSNGSPHLIYRIDSRPPEEIFLSGFTPWGNNINFFQHILGYSLGDEIPIEQRSGIISASDSPDSSLRFFGGMLNDPLERLEYYLYEIRADENVYSAQRTASFYNQRINTGLIEFAEGDLETAIDAVSSVFRDFAYQREWFNVGSIPRERVRSAWRVDSVPIDPIHIRHQQDTVYFTPRINEPEILNPHYVDEQTYANDFPFTNGATLTTTSIVSIPNEISDSDATGGIEASLGFACSPSSSKSVLNNSSNNLNCYFDTKPFHDNLKDESQIPIILSKVFYSKLFLIGSKTKNEFILSIDNEIPYLDSNLSVNKISFIYDAFQCISWYNEQKMLDFSLTINYINRQDLYEIVYNISSTNDDNQKWKLTKVNETDKYLLFRIESLSIEGFSLQRNLNNNKLYLRSIFDVSNEYEEIYIVVGDKKCDSCILLPQNRKTKLIDIGLSWYFKKQNYVIIPESGYSKPDKMINNQFFYDLNTYKILYINNSYEIFALYNNRKNYSWNWVRWIKSDMYTTNDKKLKWYFVIQKWIPNVDNINFRNIISFENNDYLRVVVYGANWGALYTTPLEGDKNSLAVFRININADI